MPSRRATGFRVRLYGRETPALVGVVTRRRDWELLLRERWYRVPARTAPEGLDKARFLAFYQTGTFGPEKWAVNYYSEVRHVRRVRRIDLLPGEPDHPRAQDEYYRVDVAGLKPLPGPIPSRRLRRIVFIPTSLERLLRAREVNDLFRTSPIEDILYDGLKDDGLEPERQYFVREDGAGSMLDLTLFCRDGNLNIECDGDRWHTGPERAASDRERDNRLASGGWTILRFSGGDIRDRPGYCLGTVRKAVQTLGGPARGGRRRRKE
ncbi:DUF559 domain-containing protein [candidate division WOR-3 bacterium]|nr:DUF559 domain-containing protein [candidate division WOR-3 bacterium]